MRDDGEMQQQDDDQMMLSESGEETAQLLLNVIKRAYEKGRFSHTLRPEARAEQTKMVDASASKANIEQKQSIIA